MAYAASCLGCPVSGGRTSQGEGLGRGPLLDIMSRRRCPDDRHFNHVERKPPKKSQRIEKSEKIRAQEKGTQRSSSQKAVTPTPCRNQHPPAANMPLRPPPPNLASASRTANLHHCLVLTRRIRPAPGPPPPPGPTQQTRTTDSALLRRSPFRSALSSCPCAVGGHVAGRGVPRVRGTQSRDTNPGAGSPGASFCIPVEPSPHSHTRPPPFPLRASRLAEPWRERPDAVVSCS